MDIDFFYLKKVKILVNMEHSLKDAIYRMIK